MSSLSAVRAILQGALSQQMTDVQDLLARNAMLSVPFTYYPNGRSNFNQLTAIDTMTTQFISDIHLGMANRDVPYTTNPDTGTFGSIVCVTSPSVIYDLRQQTDPKDWLVPQAYASPQRLLNYEIGMLLNVRFVQSPKCVLFNCGQIKVQSKVSSPINAGDGAAGPGAASPLLTKADSTYIVGQPGNATPYIQLASATTAGDMANYSVNDRITIHTQRTSAFGVTNGVDYTDGTLENRRIVAVDPTNKRLQLDLPIMIDMTTDISGNSSGTYAYVTKGIHVNSSIFIGANDGIVMGIGRPPRLKAPMAIDDFEHIHRFSWDSYQGYNLYRPAVIEVVFSAGSYREVGGFAVQS